MSQSRKRTIFYIFFTLFILGILYLTRGVLTPFILAAIFAFILDPVINFFSQKIKLPRSLSVAVIFFAIIGLLLFLGMLLTKQLVNESSQLTSYVKGIDTTTREQISFLPDWLRPIAYDSLLSVERSKLFKTETLFGYFPRALTSVFSFLIFLFSGFYFLKEGRQIIDRMLVIFPGDHRLEVEILLKKIARVFGSYLRGQLLLVVFVSFVLFIGLSFLRVPYALILAIFTGFAEIVPLIGPIVATAVAVIVVLMRGTIDNAFNPLQAALYVAILFFVVRQVQDYFITPYVLGKITKLHPLVILFAVVAGGHLYGMLGLILAVPLAAIAKLIFEFFLDRLNTAVYEESPGHVASAHHAEHSKKE